MISFQRDRDKQLDKMAREGATTSSQTILRLDGESEHTQSLNADLGTLNFGFDKKINDGDCKSGPGKDDDVELEGLTYRKRTQRVIRGYYGGKRNQKKVRKTRIVEKSGTLNVIAWHVGEQKQKFAADFFTTLVDLKWRWTTVVFVAAFVVSWIIFAVIWFLISFAHGDLDAETRADPKWVPCVANTKSFVSSFLFSLETQHTIGYGFRYISEECPEAIIVLLVQSIVGVLIQCFVVGMVFSKISRPTKRGRTLVFSKLAVICKQDGFLCFMFRLGDMRRSQLISSHVRALLIKKTVAKGGNILPQRRYNVKLAVAGDSDDVFLVWPITVYHRIDKSSPFYDMNADDFVSQKFEMVVILEGVIESTGMTTQARTSYVNEEVVWGQQFQRLLTFQHVNGLFKIDFTRFHSLTAVELPPHSARYLDEHRNQNEMNETHLAGAHAHNGPVRVERF